MDIIERTLGALDWHAVLDRLAHHARTSRGEATARAPDLVDTPDGARALYAAVAEVLDIEEEGDRIPVGTVADVGEVTERASRGQILDPPDLIAVGYTLRALVELRRWLLQRRERIPCLADLAEPIDVDPELLLRLESSFDAAGELSAETYPEIGALRAKIRGLQSRIRSTLNDLIKGDALGGALQDRFVTERGGRFVIPIKAGHRRGIGIVHDTSQSGETVFVEPAQVVEMHNQIKELDGTLRREIRRILAALSILVGRFRAEIEDALDRAVGVDMACARADLGRELHAAIPRVGDEGTILLVGARHPVLQLRGIPVVANDLSLDASRPGLVLTGPNTGGKTIAMKTLGLAALMVRAGIPVPASPESRVDIFPTVLADVGDMQSVEGDLSTFSGHVMVLRQMLDRIGHGALVLLDEIAVGTDPAQGAALARAILEAMVGSGARVVVTTHYAELKALGAVDERFVIAAMQYAGGRPTYRVRTGLAGQSHALAIALSLGLPPEILDRARTLLDTNSRDLAELLERLDRELEQVQQQEQAAAAERERLVARESKLAEREAKLRERAQSIERELTEGFQRRMAEHEQQVVDLVAALQADPQMARAGHTLEEIRRLRQTNQGRRRQAPSGPPAPAQLRRGDTVFVRPLGRQGKIVSIQGDQIEVEVGALRTRIRRRDLGRAEPQPDQRASQGRPTQTRSNRGTSNTGPRSRPTNPRPRAQPIQPAEAFGGVKVSSNSFDMRGKRVDEALDELDRFLDHQILIGGAKVYILHGHGTGALKEAVRRWLPDMGYAGRWRPGDDTEGGDAWTVVEL